MQQRKPSRCKRLGSVGEDAGGSNTSGAERCRADDQSPDAGVSVPGARRGLGAMLVLVKE